MDAVQLRNRINDERGWRFFEIQTLRNRCFSSSIPESEQKILRRSFVPIAYAHWEGFLVKSSLHYIDFVNVQNLSLSELNWNFASIFLYRERKDKIKMNDPHALIEVCNDMDKMANEDVELKLHDPEIAKSNLDHNIIISICKFMGLNDAEFANKELFIRSKLVSTRNLISHGERRYVQEMEVDEITAGVIELIDFFHNSISDSVNISSYRRPIGAPAT